MRVVVDSIDQSKQEAAIWCLGLLRTRRRWDRVVELAQVVAGRRRRAQEIRSDLFQVQRIAAWDLAAAMRVYTEVTKLKSGVNWPLWQICFLGHRTFRAETCDILEAQSKS